MDTLIEKCFKSEQILVTLCNLVTRAVIILLRPNKLLNLITQDGWMDIKTFNSNKYILCNIHNFVNAKWIIQPIDLLFLRERQKQTCSDPDHLRHQFREISVKRHWQKRYRQNAHGSVSFCNYGNYYYSMTDVAYQKRQEYNLT